MMKTLARFVVALLFVAVPVTLSPSAPAGTARPVEAALSSCSMGGENYSGGHYVGIICFSAYPSGGFVSLRVVCEYYFLYSYHTYSKTSIRQPVGTWSWVSCDNHQHGAADWLIHVTIVMDPPTAGGSSGSW